MRRAPCEVMMWNGLPVIRKEIAVSLIQQFGITQRQAAEKLGVTPAAICQYLSKKRGNTIISDQDIRIEIAAAARRINGDDGTVIIETCRICRLCAEKNVFSQNNNGHEE